MKAIKALAAAACLVILTGASPAPDWKFVGVDQLAGSGGAVMTLNVYVLANQIVALPNHHIQVWTEALAAADLAKQPLDKAGIGRAADRYIAGYRPPFTLDHPGTEGQIVSVITAEEQADQSLVLPRTKRLVEIDCQNAMLRSVSTVTYVDGKPVTDAKPEPMIHIPPGSIGANISKVVCHKP